MALASSPGIELTPAPQKVALATNYITNFDFLSQYLPDTYEKEFERYGNRSVASFLRMVSAEIPSTSDLIKWTEQGRLHIKYVSCTSAAAAGQDTATFTIGDAGVTTGALRIGQTVAIFANDASGSNKGIITALPAATTFTVAFYEAGGQAFAVNKACTVFIYGSEFVKGSSGMVGSLEAQSEIKDNSPIIMKDKYAINGSDMAQIGWVEVTSENGASGYLWYIKSEHETRLRFDDYIETAALEAVPAEANSGAVSTVKGTKGVFYEVTNNGNVWAAGNPATLAEFDTIVARLDGQGAIEENALFVNRDFSFDIDDMLAAQNSYGAGGTSYGLFQNNEQMALNLGFTGFRRGYDFYKTDWKYLNDPTMRGGLVATAGSGRINGMLVPAGTTTVYDNVLGQNIKRPFLHVRYRASQTENRKYKTWITGSAGGAATSDLDAMEVHFLTERCTCTLGANNFMIFKY
jgi:hypothetical protein